MPCNGQQVNRSTGQPQLIIIISFCLFLYCPLEHCKIILFTCFHLNLTYKSLSLTGVHTIREFRTPSSKYRQHLHGVGYHSCQNIEVSLLSACCSHLCLSVSLCIYFCAINKQSCVLPCLPNTTSVEFDAVVPMQIEIAKITKQHEITRRIQHFENYLHTY